MEMEQIKHLIVRPGEAVIIECEKHYNSEQMRMWRKVLDGVGIKAVFLGPGLKVKAVQAAE